MSEYLSVTGTGGSRDSALNFADKIAADYFNLDPGQVTRLQRTIGRAHGHQTLGGQVLVWEIDVEYRWLT